MVPNCSAIFTVFSASARAPASPASDMVARFLRGCEENGFELLVRREPFGTEFTTQAAGFDSTER
ncbi:Uncharacterised protein [Mycobacteroides abscessus subsp. abscessus]|nr:Uncharacterised protein [Mycobacteroides abscessus subsp. abscessus]